MTYPGESLEYYDAAVVEPVEDFTLYGDIYYRSDVGRTITAGDAWQVWYRADWQVANRYLTDAGADVNVSWVFEVDSGTVTVAASEGVDDVLTTGLGTYTITGPGTLVIPSQLMGAAQIVDGVDGIHVVQIEATSGSAHIGQAKIRVWPPGGPVGGWVEQPGFTTTPALPAITGAFVDRGTVSGSPGTPEDAWDDAMALLAGGASGGGAGPHPVDSDPTHFGTVTDGVSWRFAQPSVAPFLSLNTSLGGTSAIASGTPHGIIAVLSGPNPDTANPISSALVEGVDWWRPPTEIAEDYTVLAQQLGSPSVSWENPTATVTLAGVTYPVDAGPAVSSATLGADPVAAGEIDLDMVEGAASLAPSTTDTAAAVPLDATGRWVAVAVSHSMASNPVPWPGWSIFSGVRGVTFLYQLHFGEGTPGPTFAPMKGYLTMPAYRVWHAEAVTETVVRHGVRNDGRYSTAPRRWGQQSSYQSGRVGGYQ